MAEPGAPEPPRSRDSLGGTIAGQQFKVETQHLISVLLIVVIAGAFYFQQRHTADLLTQMQTNANTQIAGLRTEHEEMLERMRFLANALRLVDWNQNRSISDRVPIDLPPELFEEYRRAADPAGRASPTAPARRTAPPRGAGPAVTETELGYLGGMLLVLVLVALIMLLRGRR